MLTTLTRDPLIGLLTKTEHIFAKGLTVVKSQKKKCEKLQTTVEIAEWIPERGGRCFGVSPASPTLTAATNFSPILAAWEVQVKSVIKCCIKKGKLI